MSLESGFHLTYMMVLVENNGKETLRLSGEVAKLVFVPTKLTLQGKLYNANGETFKWPTLVLMEPAVVERNALSPR